MSESGGLSFLERDQAAGELEEREVVLGFLRPADQEGAVAVEPGVTRLDNPAAGAPSRRSPLELELLGTPTDVGRVTATDRKLADPGIAIAAVETEAMRVLG